MNIPLNIDIQQIFLHLFNFAILAGGLYILLYKPVKKFMDEREEYYKNMDKEAKEKLEKAKASEAEYEKRLSGVEDEISERRKAAAADAEKFREEELKETQRQCKKILAEAKKNGELERDRIVDGAKQEVAQLAISAMEKLMASSSDNASALDAFLNEGSNGEQGAK